MAQVIDKTVDLNLLGTDSQALAILGAFAKQAKKEDWEKSEIDAVKREAMAGNYDHLLGTIMAHCDPNHDDD